MAHLKTTSHFPGYLLTVQRQMADYRERVAERIVQTREREGLSREALALRSGVSVKQLKRIEASRSDPRLSTVRKLADALGVQVIDLRPDLAAEENSLQNQLDRIEAEVTATRVELATLSTQLADLQKLLRRKSSTGASKSRSRKAT